MKRLYWLTIPAVILLTGCDSPHPRFARVEVQKVTVDGSTFKIRIRDGYAEAIRTNFERLPKIGDTFPKAAKAIEIASGCKVIPNSMKGDPALMVAKLDCE
ncbi:MAG TPA: hypothetical protein ENK34_13310 [Rhodobacteraceae bacterium]|nr:hypothetical protein [Paracoccaceae bacterium]